MSTVSCVGMVVADKSGVDVELDVALNRGLVASGVGVIDVTHAVSNKKTASWDSFFIMGLYSLSEYGHS